MTKERKILLSFDVEEFDLPSEYEQSISIKEQLTTGYKGLMELLPVLEQPFVKTTLFTTAFFAATYPDMIRQLSVKHEIASHTYYHTTFQPDDLLLSKQKLEEITGKKVIGLRMPRMQSIQPEDVRKAGYQYNSSINPTWIPGRYNNLRCSRKPFVANGVLQVPVSVTPHLRIPLFWLAFKNFPHAVYWHLAMQTLKTDGYLLLYFHPWEFISLDAYRLPAYVKRGSEQGLLLKLSKLIKALSNEGEFCTLQEFLPLDKKNPAFV